NFRAARARADATWKDHEIWLPRRWSVHRALIRGAHNGSARRRPPGMLLLDPEAPGTLFCWRLHVGDRRCRQGGDMVRDVPVAVALHAGRGGVSLLCRARSCRMVRADRP